MSGNGKRHGVSRRSLLKYGGVSAATLVAAGQTGALEGRSSNAAGAAVRQDENEVIVTQGSHTGTLDPQDFTGAPARSIIFNAYEKLITLDFLGDNSPIPQLASDWERVEETRLRLFIREGVQWHNGDEFTPEDAAFSINRVADPEFDTTTRRELLNVEGAEVVEDERAIDLSLSNPDPIIVQRLGFAGGILQQSWTEENDQSYISRNVNGTGPYRLDEFEPDVRASFVRLDPDEYWNDDVDLSNFPERLTYISSGEASTRVNQLLANETHIIEDVQPEDIQRIENNDGTSIRDVTTDRTMMLMMRYDVEPFDSLEFRRAMNHAVDKSAIIDAILDGYGEVTHQVTPESWFGHNPGLLEEDPYPYDPQRAEQLIEESGHAGEQITLAVPQGRYLKDSEVGQAIAGQIDSLSNISVDVEIRSWSSHRDLIAPELEQKPAFHFFGFGSAPPDASIKIDRNFTCETLETDFSTFCDEDVDALSQQAENTTDQEERRQILAEANRVLIEEKAACVPIYFQAALYGVNTDVVDFTPIQQEEVYWFSMDTQ